MNTGNKQSGTSAATEPAKAGSKLTKILIYMQFVFAMFVFAVGAYMETSKEFENSHNTLPFLLVALGLLLASLSAFKLSENQQRALTLVSVLVAGLGAYFHVVGLKQQGEDGPRVNTVAFQFTAPGYDVQPATGQPCTLEDNGYTCYVKVTPLKQPAAPAQ